MISERSLALAVERGTISAEQLAALRSIEDGLRRREPRDDEALRLVSGFADMFATIGIVLFLGAIGLFSPRGLHPAATALVLAGASWLLAEFFTRRRRMALPSTALLLAFTLSVFTAAQILGGAEGTSATWRLWPPAHPVLVQPALIQGAALATAVAAALHYWRFRVPITVAVGVAAASAALLAGLDRLAPTLVGAWWQSILFALGVAVFALAMRFDVSDPLRATRRTDIAFWLHMLAAPLIVHPLVRGLTAVGGNGSGSAWAVLFAFALLGMIALLVDRRAVLVAGLSYAGLALSSLLGGMALDAGNTFALTMLALGGVVILLSAGWHGLRRRLLGTLSPGLAARLPPTPHSRFDPEPRHA